MELLSCFHKPEENVWLIGTIQDTSSASPFLSVIDLGVDDRAGDGVDEDVIVNAAGDGTDLVHGMEAWLHRLTRHLTLLGRLLALLCRLLTLLSRLLIRLCRLLTLLIR